MNDNHMQEFVDFEEMFATPGWKRYIKQVQITRDGTLQAAPENASDNNKWQYCRGMLSQMQSVLSFEVYVSTVKEDLLKEEAEKLASDEDE